MKNDVFKKIVESRQNLIENNALSKLDRTIYYDAILSRAEAVRAMCHSCIGFTGTSDITNCRGYTCPLYFHRPNQNEGDQDMAKQLSKTEKRPLWPMTTPRPNFVKRPGKNQGADA